VSRLAPRKPRRRAGSRPTAAAVRTVRRLWLDSDAVQAAEACAKAVGVPVARFIDSVLLELCGEPKRLKRPPGGTSQGEARVPAEVIRIDRPSRR